METLECFLMEISLVCESCRLPVHLHGLHERSACAGPELQWRGCAPLWPCGGGAAR